MANWLLDYIEMTEYIPSELKEQLTSIRELDLQVHNAMDELDRDIKQFFSKTETLTQQERQDQYDAILKRYDIASKAASDKVKVADKLHDLVEKSMRLLDQGLEKLKEDLLEGDKAFVVEDLERRSQEEDEQMRLEHETMLQRQKKSHESKTHSKSQSHHHHHHYKSSFGNTPGFKNSSNHKNNNIAPNLPFNQQHSALSAALASTTTTNQLNSVSALAMMNATSVQNKISNNFKGNELIDPNSPLVRQNPLAAAASQAIAATQQLHQGRRTPSLKASFAAINAAGLGGQLDSLGIKQQQQQHDTITANNRNALAPMTPDQQAFSRYNQQQQQFSKLNANGNGNSSPLYISVTKSGRPSKRPRHHASHLYPDESPTSISSYNSVFENSESLSSTDFIETGTTFGSASPSSLDFSTNTAQGNTPLYHRDETKYCICRQISYGEMVACDNTECEIEWFHYDCVGITQPPKGKWFCSECTHKMTGHHQQQQQHHNNQPQTQKKRGRKEKSWFNLVNSSIDTVRSKDRSVRAE